MAKYRDPVQTTPPAGTGSGAFGGGGAPPAPPPKGGKSERDTYLDWAVKLGVKRKTAADIWYMANTLPQASGLIGFAYYYTAVLKRESGASHLNKYGKITDSGQAIGIAQIDKKKIGTPIPWETDKNIVWTADNDPHTGLGNYALNLRLGAYMLAQGVASYGYDGAYLKVYNPTGKGNVQADSDIKKTLKTLPAGIGPLAPTSGGGQNPDAGKPPVASAKDPWVMGISKGHLALNNSVDPPLNALQFDGAPMRRSNFLSLKRQLENYYVSYTGGRPSDAQILTFIQKGWSNYTLEVELSKLPGFTKSPIWKHYEPTYREAAKDILPQGQTLDDATIRSAIINKWDGTALQTQLRKLPNYAKSNEFKNNAATLLNVHSSIMGTPDDAGISTLHQAAIQGWNTNQYAAYLRSQPQYVQSPEYQTKAMTFLSSLGLITGDRVTLRKGAVNPLENANPTGFGPIPSDPRLPKATLTNPEDTVVGFGHS